MKIYLMKKSDGTRIVRYKGPNEEFDVRQLYERLKKEIINQNSHQKLNFNNPKDILVKAISFVCIAVIFIGYIIYDDSSNKNNGYYLYNDKYYYYQTGNWYVYDKNK